MVNDISFKRIRSLILIAALFATALETPFLPNGPRTADSRGGKIYSSLISNKVSKRTHFISLANMTITAAPYREIARYHSLNVDSFSRPEAKNFPLLPRIEFSSFSL